MRAWQRLRRRWLAQGGAPQGAGEVVSEVGEWLAAGGGPIGRVVRAAGLAAQRPLPGGKSPPSVFPIPFICMRTALKGIQPESRRIPVRQEVTWVNIIIAYLNMLYAGHEDGAVSRSQPSAAQNRIHAGLRESVTSFLGEGAPWPKTESIHECLRLSDQYAGGKATARALGMKGGVPPCAADVDLFEALHSSRPDVARQVREPTELLLPPSERPHKLPRPYINVEDTYPEFVARNVAVGLQTLAPESRVWRHAGKPLISGVFAVKKSEDEDRVISAVVPLSHLLDARRLLRPVFAYTPRMHRLKTRTGARVTVSKRDARHYFHRLKIGKNWAKFLAHPPVVSERGKTLYPLHRCTPMGFSPSAGPTNVCTENAGLPTDKQVLFSQPIPSDFLVWGSIIDDVWAVDETSR